MVSLAEGRIKAMENDTSLVLLRPATLYRAGHERAHRVSKRGRPRTSYVEEKVMEFLEALSEGMPTRSAAAIAQIPFETVRNWMSKNDAAFRPEFFRAFERAKAIAVRKSIKKLRDSKTGGCVAPQPEIWNRFLILMAEDGVFLLPGQPPMRGRDAFAAGSRSGSASAAFQRCSFSAAASCGNKSRASQARRAIVDQLAALDATTQTS